MIARCLFNNGLKSFSEEQEGMKLYSFKIPAHLLEQTKAGATAVAWTKNNLQIVKVVKVIEEYEKEAEVATQNIVAIIDVSRELQVQLDRLKAKQLLEQTRQYLKHLEREAEKNEVLEELKALKGKDKKLDNLVNELLEISSRGNLQC